MAAMWRCIPVGARDEQMVYGLANQYKSGRFEAEESKNYQLRIKSIGSSDSGYYHCTHLYDDSPTDEIKVNVLVVPPLITADAERPESVTTTASRSLANKKTINGFTMTLAP
jgi:hypothetical protein